MPPLRQVACRRRTSARHRDHVDRQLLATAGGQAGVTDFLALIREVITVDETVKQYFSETQLAELAERRSRPSG